MARDREDIDFLAPVRRILLALVIGILALSFVVWRIDSPRVERFRAALVDRVMPSFSWAMLPVTKATAMMSCWPMLRALSEFCALIRACLSLFRLSS